MSIASPLRIKVKSNGTTIGFFEAIDFLGTTVVRNGPIAEVTASGGGGGDAATLEGHPASYFGTAADVATLNLDIDTILALIGRDAVWAALLGVAVQSTAPASGITYAQWVAGVPGNHAWLQIP